MRGAALAIGIGLFALPLSAHCTSLEPTFIKMLGYDARGERVFFFVDSGYSSCLHFMRVAPRSGGRAVLVSQFEWLYLSRLLELERHDQNVSRMAQDAEVDRHAIRKLMRKHGLGHKAD